MKSTSIAFYASTILTIFIGPAKVDGLEEEATFADSPVTINAACIGDTNIDWSTLSLAELTSAGKALAASYNTIHAATDNDDSQLRDLIFSGDDNRRMLDEDESLSWKRRPVKGKIYFSISRLDER
jgi:hypothetical protein